MNAKTKDLIEDKIIIVCQEFDNKYMKKKITLHNISNLSYSIIKDLYKEIVSCVIYDNKKHDFQELLTKLTNIYVKLNISYESLNNELNYLKKSLLYIVLEIDTNKRALEILDAFDKMDILITQTFLTNYLNNLIENNNLRLKTIHATLQDKMIGYYEAHIIWVNNLATSILQRDVNKLPQTDHHKCIFGKWLDGDDVRNTITNTNDYLHLYEIHKNLHNISKEIFTLISTNESYADSYLIYINKAEDISREIGMKLSVLSNEITKQKATKDPLTGVLNRELLDKLFTKEIELHATTQNSMLFAICDLDHFKIVNDTYGHLAGDKVLQFFASLLQTQLRATDIIIRYGGEEFVLILPSANLFQGVQVLNNLRKKLKNNIIIYEEDEIKVTVSIGLIELKPQMSQDEKEIFLESTIKKADDLLYKAKNNGRDRIEI